MHSALHNSRLRSLEAHRQSTWVTVGPTSSASYQNARLQRSQNGGEAPRGTLGEARLVPHPEPQPLAASAVQAPADSNAKPPTVSGADQPASDAVVSKGKSKNSKAGRQPPAPRWKVKRLPAKAARGRLKTDKSFTWTDASAGSTAITTSGTSRRRPAVAACLVRVARGQLATAYGEALEQALADDPHVYVLRRVNVSLTLRLSAGLSTSASPRIGRLPGSRRSSRDR